MSSADQGRILIKYNLGQRKKEGFLSRASALLREQRRTGKKIKKAKIQSHKNSLQLRMARRREMFRQGQWMVAILFAFVALLMYGAWYWLM